jgi:hypothetical protein
MAISICFLTCSCVDARLVDGSLCDVEGPGSVTMLLRTASKQQNSYDKPITPTTEALWRAMRSIPRPDLAKFLVRSTGARALRKLSRE